jgi:hypothetical protein
MATIDRDAEKQYEATPAEAAMTDLPQGQVAPSEQEVPASLNQLLATHGSHPRLDSRRYLRRWSWLRVAGAAHAVAAAGLPLAVAAVMGTGPALAVALPAGALAAGVVAYSHRVAAGQPLREMVSASVAAVSAATLAGVMPSFVAAAGVAPALVAAAFRAGAMVGAVGCGAVVVTSLARGGETAPRAVRLSAVMAGVMGVIAAAM